MKPDRTRPNCAPALTAVIAFLAITAGINVAADCAEPLSTRTIIDRLKPSSGGDGGASPRLRGIMIVPPDAGAKPATPDVSRPKDLPSINFAINFALDSTAFDATAVKVLGTLGEALRHEELRPYVFEIAGHTDAAGSSGYNQRLSERRATAVRRYLIETYGIEAGRLRAVGYGESRLLDRARPRSGVNRRVQVTNLGRR